jgi:uncharacterized 2Fe-2S/4Fe-4S cluster protein (DUF4445 family)
VPLSIQAGSDLRSVRTGYPVLLTEAAERAGLPLNTRCAGQGACGGCAVQLAAGRYRIAGRDVRVPPGETRTALACQTEVLEDSASVVFPLSSVLEKSAVIDEDFLLGSRSERPAFQRIPFRLPAERDGSARSLEEILLAALEPACAMTVAPIPHSVLVQFARVAERGETRFSAVGAVRDGTFRVLDLMPGGTPGDALGLAVDVGTTTVVALLTDLDTGRILAKASMYNQQIRKADDVASRISACRTPEDEAVLQRLILRDTVNPLLAEVCEKAGGKDPGRVLDVVFSGNTVMGHLLLGLPVEGIGRLPFLPVQTRHPETDAGPLGLDTAPHARVRVVPSIAGYLGGDITSDLHVTGMADGEETCLLLDIGTNGEMALRSEGRLTACATAAGPAFEGYGLRHGCRACAGAIEHIEIGPDLEFRLQTIGHLPPIGLCGSALIDFIACGFRCGLLNPMGRLDVARLKQAGRHLRDPELTDGSDACVLVRAGEQGRTAPLTLSDREIARILNAKAAIYAGLTTLLEESGKTEADLRRVYLAGGFARHIRLRNAVTLGMLPDLPLDRFTIIGNGSLAGAYLALVDAEAWGAYERIALLPRGIELNRQASFESNFIDAHGIPNLHPDRFPGVGRP